MSKYIVPNFRTAVVQYEADAKERARNISRDLMPAVANTLNLPANVGNDPNDMHAAGTAVAVETPAYRQWLARWQKVNPLIGAKRTDKDGNVIGDMFEAAPEFENESEETKKPEDMPQEVVDSIGKWKKDMDGHVRYHINDDYQPYMPKEFDQELDGDAAKLSDLWTIQTAVSKRLGFDFEDVMKGVVEDLKAFHVDDLDFELPDDLEGIVKKVIAVEETRARIGYDRNSTAPELPGEVDFNKGTTDGMTTVSAKK